MNSEKLIELLKELAVQIPSLVTILFCMIVAVVRWKRHPQVSLTVLSGLVLMLVVFIVFSVLYTWVPDWIINSADSASKETLTRNVYLVMGLISNFFTAVGLGLLLAAIFMRRDPTRQLSA